YVASFHHGPWNFIDIHKVKPDSAKKRDFGNEMVSRNSNQLWEFSCYLLQLGLEVDAFLAPAGHLVDDERGVEGLHVVDLAHLHRHRRVREVGRLRPHPSSSTPAYPSSSIPFSAASPNSTAVGATAFFSAASSIGGRHWRGMGAEG
ncbi:uncharacterized protein LOC123425334, partial [Hordeum vulgare subsp. vulgare]|uniref:uncharacterized protein LOC123425334 n=1 Tax=Hordeum vulgare subsp. vulgare TaxID=112509 RepID=UPI001D1A4C1C